MLNHDPVVKALERSEVATGGALWEKVFLDISQNS